MAQFEGNVLGVREEVKVRTYRQVVPQLTLLQLQRRLCHVKLWNGESWDGIVEMKTESHQPDVHVCIWKRTQMMKI